MIHQTLENKSSTEITVGGKGHVGASTISDVIAARWAATWQAGREPKLW